MSQVIYRAFVIVAVLANLLIIATVKCPADSGQRAITGKCVGVHDGDTITILVEQRQIKVRLSSIDAPEKAQPFGTKSREHLAKLVHENEVRVVTSGTDRYGRTLGTVWIGDTNVNDEQVRAGLAWQYRQYDKSKVLADLEKDARLARRGLWADKDPVEPWAWRKGKKSKE